MSVKLWIFVGVIIFATFPRLVSTEPGFRSKSSLEQAALENDNPPPQNDDQDEDLEYLVLNTNFEPDHFKLRKAHSEEITIIKIVHGGHQHIKAADKEPEPVVKIRDIPDTFYHADCETDADCALMDSSGMECVDGRCECMIVDDMPLRYHAVIKKCLGADGHICTHDYACFSRSCVKPLKGKRWAEGNFRGVCESWSDFGADGVYLENNNLFVCVLVVSLFAFAACLAFCLVILLIKFIKLYNHYVPYFE